MGRLAVVVTSPRIPGTALTPAAWRVIFSADVVAIARPDQPISGALADAGVEVQVLPGSGAGDLLALAVSRNVVWLADEGDDELTHELAEVVVRRSESTGTGPEVEIVVGSFDPVGARLLDAVAVMDTLRQECPWDRQQTHESLLPYLVEETYEVVDAVESGDKDHLREELGDLLFQVLFHARVAAEPATEAFSIDDVAGHLVDKLVRRHPHVFDGLDVAGVADVEANWERIKRAEKSRGSVMDGIPLGLPALSLADSVIDRALRASVELGVPVPPSAAGPDQGEVGEHAGAAYNDETLGEVLFALVAAARVAGLDAERALRTRVRREIAAVRSLEQRALQSNDDPRG